MMILCITLFPIVLQMHNNLVETKGLNFEPELKNSLWRFCSRLEVITYIHVHAQSQFLKNALDVYNFLPLVLFYKSAPIC